MHSPPCEAFFPELCFVLQPAASEVCKNSSSAGSSIRAKAWDGLVGARRAKLNAAHDVARLQQSLEDQLVKRIKLSEESTTGKVKLATSLARTPAEAWQPTVTRLCLKTICVDFAEATLLMSNMLCWSLASCYQKR